jgi:hypothetical protein
MLAIFNPHWNPDLQKLPSFFPVGDAASDPVMFIHRRMGPQSSIQGNALAMGPQALFNLTLVATRCGKRATC